MNLTIVSGSPRAQSATYRVALMLYNKLKQEQPQYNITLLDVRNTPQEFVENVIPSLDKAATPWRETAQIIFNTDAFLLVTPEYNGNYSPAMKNLFDHFPKQSRKTFGIVTASPGAMGGMRAAMHLQQGVAALFGILSPQMLLIGNMQQKINDQGDIIDEKFEINVNSFLSEYLWLAQTVKGA